MLTEGRSKKEIIRFEDQFYVLATSALADSRTRVLKEGDTFGVLDVFGDVQPLGSGHQGLYLGATRFLSSLELRLGTERPLFLSSTIRNDNHLLAVDLMNPDYHDETGKLVPHGSLHLFRTKFLWQGICYERLRVTNFENVPVSVRLSFQYAADFADIFEVRGNKRLRRGAMTTPTVGHRDVVIGYEGLDKVIRRTKLEFHPAPTVLTGQEAVFQFSLAPQQRTAIFTSIFFEEKDQPKKVSYYRATSAWAQQNKLLGEHACRLSSSNDHLNSLLDRSFADINLMTTRTPFGLYPYAGIPWFNTVFGRDGIITALQMLFMNPQIARGVLSYLADTQAKEDNAAEDAEPGKILHERRSGEMVALGEVPFKRYYGSVDSTPLFVILAGAYFERTNDLEFLRSIWGNVKRALQWMNVSGDKDGDGFVEYHRRSPEGLLNQGWKDSGDSVFHADGSVAEGPIALCEVQGYVFDAKKRAASLALTLGEADFSRQLKEEAESLRKKFEEEFWWEEKGTYYIALDGKKNPCKILASNAGHCLFSGIVDPKRARRLAETMTSYEMFSGWGVRTLGAFQPKYNPMSYHRGSVWPHDSTIIAAGLARYGFKEAAMKILMGLFDVSSHVDLYRLPELFCGFERRPGEGPTSYPVSCSPQAWAAGSIFMLLKEILGIKIEGATSRIVFDSPQLPPISEKLVIKNLAVAAGSVDLLIRRHGDVDVGIDVLRQDGDVEVAITKQSKSGFFHQ